MSNGLLIPISITRELEKAERSIFKVKKELKKISQSRPKKISRRRMTEQDVLKMVAQAEKEYKQGKTRLFDDMIREDHPELAYLLPPK